MPGGGDDPARLGDLLGRTLSELGVPADVLGLLSERWAEVAGDAAAWSRPVSLADGVLVVAADDGAGAARLRWEQSRLLEGCERVAPGSVQAVEVRVRPARH